MPPLPKGVCQVCKRTVAVRVNGDLREHRPTPSAEGPLCQGRRPVRDLQDVVPAPLVDRVLGAQARAIGSALEVVEQCGSPWAEVPGELAEAGIDTFFYTLLKSEEDPDAVDPATAALSVGEVAFVLGMTDDKGNWL